MKYFTSLSFSLLLSFFAIAQNDGVGIGTVTVEPDAILQIDATAKGILIPRITTEARTEQLSPTSDGLMVYDEDIKAFFYYDAAATQWKRLVQEESFGVVPIGGIIMWSGDAADVPSNFALCDGSQAGVPDLTDRFILGGSVAGEGTDKIAIQDGLDEFTPGGEDCSPYEFLYTVIFVVASAPEPGSLGYETCLEMYNSDTQQIISDIPASNCIQATNIGLSYILDIGCDFSVYVNQAPPGQPLEGPQGCTPNPNPDYYLNNPNCRVAASYYQLAFIMRVE